MEITVESAPTQFPGRLSIKMLGRLSLTRADVPIALPASRKVRALLAYLALAPQPVERLELCRLLWDVPNDPRGELRWSLSKLRSVLNEAGCERIETSGDTVRMRLDRCEIDAVEVLRATDDGLEALDTERLVQLAAFASGEFLDGMESGRNAQFNSWLVAQRRKLQSRHVLVLERLVSRLKEVGTDAMPYMERWIELAPFDTRAHLALLKSLHDQGQSDSGERHRKAAERRFLSEGVDFSAVNDAWRTLRDAACRQTTAVAAEVGAPDAKAAAASRRASLAVMPFEELSAESFHGGGLADGLTHDIITRLAKLRAFFVIARGSVYALSKKKFGPEEAGRRLNVDYVANGSVRRNGGRICVGVELVEVPTGRIIWSETYEAKPDDLFAVLNDIGNNIVSSIANEIENVERNRAILKAPNSLDAWEAYHRGLWHVYRFTQSENILAKHFFSVATRLDPTFARAHAALSFTHWQNAFQGWGDRDEAAVLAYQTASRSLSIDEHNPAAHWALGRALWLRGSNDESLGELEQAVELSPNFALGHYALAFVHSQSGNPSLAITAADQSRHLSPFDPLLFGMLGARAMAHVRLGQFEEAAYWALKAAARPNSHTHILAIAANCLGLAGRVDEGRVLADRIRQVLPTYNSEDFLTSFRFEPEAANLYRVGSRRVGLD